MRQAQVCPAVWLNPPQPRLRLSRTLVEGYPGSGCCRRPVSAGLFEVSAGYPDALPTLDRSLHAAPSQRGMLLGVLAPATTSDAVCKAPQAAVLLAADWGHEVPGRAREVLDIPGA